MKCKVDNIVACICEGASEKAIIDVLLDNEKLIFSREQLLDEEIIETRKASVFERNYLNKDYGDRKIDIYRIIDSGKENFKLKSVYLDIVNVMNVLTRPEIEILIIIAEGHYDKYKKQTKKIPKASIYCKNVLKMKKVKEYDFIKKYFSNPEKLISTIAEYHRISNKKENTLYGLLKEEFKV